MQFLGADAHFRTESKYIAVGKAGGSIGVNCGRVNTGHKFAYRVVVFTDNGLTVSGPVLVDMVNGCFQTIHHFDRYNQVKIFRSPVLGSGFSQTGYDTAGSITTADFHPG